MNKIIVTIVSVLIIIGGIYYFSKPASVSKLVNEDVTLTPTPPVRDTIVLDTPMTNPSAPAMQIDKNKIYTALMSTSQGDITIELTTSQTPITVNNFVTLAKKGFYNNTIFHRVIKGFMIQGGDPKGDGTGGPGYTFADEPFSGEYTRGTIAMANAGPNTNGSQFFIMHEDYNLPKNYVIFGHVTQGLDVIDAIANQAVTTSSSGEPSKPVTPTTLKTVTIVEK